MAFLSEKTQHLFIYVETNVLCTATDPTPTGWIRSLALHPEIERWLACPEARIAMDHKI